MKCPVVLEIGRQAMFCISASLVNNPCVHSCIYIHQLTTLSPQREEGEMREQASVNLIQDDFCVDIDELAGDDICVLAKPDASSLCIHICGRARYSNFNSMSSKPPSSMSSIDRGVWRRFYRHFFLAGVKTRRLCRTLFCVLFAILMMSSDAMNESAVNVLPVLILITSVGYVFETWWNYRSSGEKYRKIVMKMTPTFQAQGYHVEFIEPPLCTYDRIFAGRWICFTRNGFPVPSLQEPTCTDDEQARTAEQLTPFKPEDWQPLEGTWKLKDPSKFKGHMPWLIQTQSMTWTFRNTASETTFDSSIESQANICYSIFPMKKSIQHFTLQDNALHMKLMNAISLKDGLVEASEGDLYVPIPMEDRRSRSLYKKGQNHIVLVQRSTRKEKPDTLKVIEFEFVEDIPNNELLVAGALDNLTEEKLQDMGGIIRLQLEFQEPEEYTVIS